MHNLQPHGGWRTSHNAGELTMQPGANSQHLYCMKIKQRYRIWCMDRNKLRLFWYSQTILPQSKQTYTWFHCHCLRFMFQACLITHTTSIARIDHDSLVMLVVHQSNVWCAVHTTKTIGGGNKTTCGSTGHGSKKNNIFPKRNKTPSVLSLHAESNTYLMCLLFRWAYAARGFGIALVTTGANN